MMNLSTWILTFNRPVALNRQIDSFSHWTDVKIFTNHPDVQLSAVNHDLHARGFLPILYNSLSDPEATSYCARSWNNIFLKAFKHVDEIICVQDDTQINDWQTFRDLIFENRNQYDLIWGPGGDQFFYMKKKVLQTVGWFDERFCTGCFCGDADWLKRIWQQYDKSKLSIYETHDWGFVHNDIGLGQLIPTHIGSKAIDPTYVNQHQETQKIFKNEECMIYAQDWWREKWGHSLNGEGPITQHTNPPRHAELFLYPWFVKKYLLIDGVPIWCKHGDSLCNNK